MAKKYRPLVLLRLSSIGDILISSELMLELSSSKYLPIYFVSKEYLEILRSLNGLKYAITISKKTSTLNFYLRLDEKDNFKNVEYKKFLASLKDDCDDLKSVLLDLQNTKKSLKASYLLKKFLTIEKKISVSKRLFYRLYLIIKAYFLSLFKQMKVPKKKGFLNIVIRVHDLQLRALRKLLNNKKENLNKQSEILSPLRVSFLNLPKKYGEYIILFPSSSYFNKNWPKEKFRLLKDNILKNTTFNVIICGGKKDESLGEFLSYPLNKKVTNLVNKLSISETLSLISGAKYIVTGDSFASHAANLYKVSGTVIFGPTSPKFGFTPKYKGLTVEYANLNCSPCSRHGQGECRFMNLKCQEDISVNKVLNNILRHTKHEKL